MSLSILKNLKNASRYTNILCRSSSLPSFASKSVWACSQFVGLRYYDIVSNEHLKKEGISIRSTKVGLSNSLSKPQNSIKDVSITETKSEDQENMKQNNEKALDKAHILFQLFKTSTSVSRFYELISMLLDNNTELRSIEINEIMKHMNSRHLWRLSLFIYEKYHDSEEFNEDAYVYTLKALKEGNCENKLKDIWSEINNKYITKSEPLLCAYLECVFHYNDLQTALYIYTLVEPKRKYISPAIVASILTGIQGRHMYHECIHVFEKFEEEGSQMNDIAYQCYIHSLLELHQYDKCIAIYTDMRARGISPTIGVYVDMITLYDQSNVYSSVYNYIMQLSEDINAQTTVDTRSCLSRHISDEQREQGLWLLREMITVTKYVIPEVKRKGTIYIDYTSIPLSVSRFNTLSVFSKIKKNYTSSSSSSSFSNSISYSTSTNLVTNNRPTVLYPSVEITTSGEYEKIMGITRILKEELRPAVSYTEENGIIKVSSSSIQQWLSSFYKHKF
ncbi:hypothetical protein WA158_001271 [Blastocystis sp. Blastoise]